MYQRVLTNNTSNKHLFFTQQQTVPSGPRKALLALRQIDVSSSGPQHLKYHIQKNITTSIGEMGCYYIYIYIYVTI